MIQKTDWSLSVDCQKWLERLRQMGEMFLFPFFKLNGIFLKKEKEDMRRPAL